MKSIYLDPQVASAYHAHRLQTNFRLYKHWLEIFILGKYLKILESPVLDVGCGTGRISEYLLSKGFRLTCLDNSLAMLAQLKSRLRPYSKKYKVIEGSITKMPFRARSFSTIVSFRVIWHLSDKDLKKALREMMRVSSDYVIFDITNSHYQQSLLFLIYKKFFSRNQPNSRYLDQDKITEEIKSGKFALVQKFGLGGFPHVWLNFWPHKNPIFLFEIVRWIDIFLSLFIPPQRFLLIFKRNL